MIPTIFPVPKKSAVSTSNDYRPVQSLVFSAGAPVLSDGY